MNNLELGVIGNCAFSALINRRGRVVWCCLPRFDGDPIFCSLINGSETGAERGFFDLLIDDFSHSEQHYEPNTAILVTTLYDQHGAAVEITDFAPRFVRYERMHRPQRLIRLLKPLHGTPRIRIRLRPTQDYGRALLRRVHGSNHINYVGDQVSYRLTTDVPVSFLLDEVPFLLEGPAALIFGSDDPIRRSVADATRESYEQTLHYWRDWTRSLSIPFEWQDEVIRAAITLKLCCFEETGAVIAAMTTSIPEAAGTQRNWDYRYCWLRDAYFVINALNRLGTTKTMEQYLHYIANIAAGAKDSLLQPVYSITLEPKLVEREIETLAGYRNHAPVRVGNQAYEHIQNDVYGSVIMAATQAFFDRRLAHPGDRRLFERLENLGYQCAKLYNQPDASLWEFRGIARVHTFSAVMCWAGCDRLARISRRLELRDRAQYWQGQADRIRDEIVERAYDPLRNTFVGSFGGQELDASLLLLHDLQFLAADDPRFLGTVEAVEAALRRGNHMMRYIEDDDFGTPQNAFNICTFWLISALAAIGRKDDARAIFEAMLQCRNSLGLLSEDTDPVTGEMWGNFPQTYSMVGIIHSAVVLSKPWEEAF
ncbi:glycoside hydrolase family 15 protein [Candidatus Methylocalor cossyra]|uniref:Glucoamylase n=1 Tax=Candidatus Methylocalor cossyra TaxID=3108543 RepID=A0ABM9NFN8_9GAMM